jgi:hypothetical protein
MIKIAFSFLATGIMIAGCSAFSESIQQPSAGLNGSFETVQDHLPVNWLLYTRIDAAQADFDFEVNEQNASDGQRSAHFTIRHCKPSGGHLSPGLAQEISVKGNRTYRISFDARNLGSTLVFEGGPVSLKKGQSLELLRESNAIAHWQTYSFDVHIPLHDSILFMQWNWIAPGEGWLDNVKVQELG